MDMNGKKQVRSILIIDDDRDDYELVQEAMQEINPGISVHYLDQCTDACNILDRKYDLVLLDINMPKYDGFFCLKSIRNGGYSDLPIIMFTNSLSPMHISKAYREGANLYFSKPESFTRLIEGLKALIKIDWSDPFSITKKYGKEGHCKTFEYA